MITALDLQAAPQMVDGAKAQAAQPDGSSDSGDFGAAFAANLSSSSSPAQSANTSDSGTPASRGSLQQNPSTVRNTANPSAPVQKAAVSSGGAAINVKLAVKTTALTLLNAGAKGSSVDALSDAPAADTIKPAVAPPTSSADKAAKQTADTSSELVKALASDFQLLLKSNGAAVADKASSVAAIKLAELQASLAGASRLSTSKVSQELKASTPSKVSEVVGKSKATPNDAQPAAGDVLLASLGAGAPLLTVSSLVSTAATKGTSVEAGGEPKAQPGPTVQNPGAGLSSTTAGASKSNLANVWNSIAIEAPSARNAGTTGTSYGARQSELVHVPVASESSLGGAAAPGTGVELSSAVRLPTPPVYLPTPAVAVDVPQSSEVATSSASAALPIATGTDLHTNAPGAGLSSASSENTVVPASSIASDTLVSSVLARSQTATVAPLASRSLTSAAKVRDTTAGIAASASRATGVALQNELTQTTGVATASTSGVVQADTKAAQIGNQQHAGAEASAATVSGTANIKPAVVPPERTSSLHPSVAAAATETVAASHRGSSDTSTATPDRGAASDAATVHGDSSAAVVATHTAQTPAVEIANSSNVSSAILNATVAHQGLVAPANLSTPTAAGSAGASTLQAAGTEAVHGASALSGAISSAPHQTLAATPTSLEVGVHSGTQGWLKIRAEVGDQGDVTASLASTSSSGQQVLKGQLPALNAYLQSEQMSVTTSVAERIGATHVAVAHEALFGSSSAGTGSAGQDASLLQSGAGQGAFSQGGGQQGSGLDRSSVPIDSGRSELVQSYANRVESSASTPGSTAVEGSGRWLNVRV